MKYVKNKKQENRLNEMEGELLMLRKRKEEFNENQDKLSEYKQQHLSLTKKLNEKEEQFQATNMS